MEVHRRVRLPVEQEPLAEEGVDLRELRGRVDYAFGGLGGQGEEDVALRDREVSFCVRRGRREGDGRRGEERTMLSVSSPLGSITRVPRSSARRCAPESASWWQ